MFWNEYERKVVWYIKCAHKRILPLLLLLIFIQFYIYICSVHKLTHGRCKIYTRCTAGVNATEHTQNTVTRQIYISSKFPRNWGTINILGCYIFAFGFYISAVLWSLNTTKKKKKKMKIKRHRNCTKRTTGEKKELHSSEPHTL